MSEDQETAVCRGCGRQLKGKPYYMGGSAYVPSTGKQAKVCHYGGFVCSYTCDTRACRDLESSMPGHSFDQIARLSCYAQDRVKSNWPEQF
jgi:hypothetical protein